MPQKFEEYPKYMKHPHEKPAVLGTEYGQGKPMQFAPVVVNNKRQEEEYASKGYEPAGKSNVAAFNRAMIAPVDDTYVYAEYPKWVNGVLVQDPAIVEDKSNPNEYPKYVEGVLVQNWDEEEALILSIKPVEKRKA